MLPSWLRLIANQPQLLTDHAQAYTELLGLAFADAASTWQCKAILSIVALACATVGVTLAGVALMLWTVMPDLPPTAPWVLVLTPLAPLIASGWAILAAQSTLASHAFDTVREQFQADVVMLREVSGP